MISQAKYNTKSCFALLQLYLALMDGEEIDFEYFSELTGLSKSEFNKKMNDINQMTSDLHLSCLLHRVEIDVSTNETEYKKYKYYFSSRSDYSFDITGLDDELLIRYSAVIVYLKLKKRQYVTSSNLSKLFPNFTRNVFMDLINKLQDVIGEDLYKDEFQSYVIEDFE